MIKNKVQLEIEKNDRTYSLNMDPESPLGELYDVLSEMRGYVFGRLKEAEEHQKKQEENPIETQKE